MSAQPPYLPISSPAAARCQHQPRRPADRAERNMFLQTVDDGQQAGADLERRNTESRVAVVSQWVAAKFQNLTFTGRAPVCNAVEVRAWNEPNAFDGDRRQQKDRVEKCRVFPNATGWVICLSFHQPVAIDIARGLDLDGVAGTPPRRPAVASTGSSSATGVNSWSSPSEETIEYSAIANSPARPSSVLSMSAPAPRFVGWRECAIAICGVRPWPARTARAGPSYASYLVSWPRPAPPGCAVVWTFT